MAKAKQAVTEPTPAPARGSSSLSHGRAAAGASQLRPGFAIDPEHDLAFALGYPHLEYLLDGHPDDADPAAHAAARTYYQDGWPRGVAARWCRLTASGGFRRTPDQRVVLDAKGKKAVARATPLGADEGEALIASLFTSTAWREDLRILVRLIEALVGPEPVARGLARGLAGAGDAVWSERDQERALVVFHAGFSLLRVPPAQAGELRARLEEVFEREARKRCGGEVGPRSPLLVRALDLALHGRAGAERSAARVGGQLELADLAHVTDDPAFVLGCVRARDRRALCFDSRLVFLAGEPALDWWLPGFQKAYRAHYPIMARNFGPIRAPAVVEMLGVMARSKTAKPQARAWLDRRG